MNYGKKLACLKFSKLSGGDCYNIAGNLIVDNKDWLLCHGIVDGQGPLKGQKIGHAWNEHQDVVFDYSNSKKVILRKEQYYALGNIKKVIKYKREEALRMMSRYKHYGPWDSSVKSPWQIEQAIERENVKAIHSN